MNFKFVGGYAMRLKNQKGVTLVELLVTLLVSGILVTAMYQIFSVHHKIAIRQEETTLMQQELLSAISQIADDLRMCGYSPKGERGFGFTNLPGIGSPHYGRTNTVTSIYCTLDLNGDGLINESGVGSSGEHVAYRVNVFDSGAEKTEPDHVLRKYATGAVHWQPVSTNIAALRFVYFDAHGAPISDPAAQLNKIRAVQVHLTAVPSSQRSGLGIGNRTMSTLVFCRNIRE